MRALPHLAALTVLALALTTAPTDATPAPVTSDAPHHVRQVQAKKMPKLKVHRQVRGLDHPWDVASLGSGQLLFTQRDRATLSVFANGKVHRIRWNNRVWVSGETGLMGLAVDPDFATNRRVYTCQGGFAGRGHDVRVMAWTLDAKVRRATKVRKLIGGFPTSSGRHGGCRLLIATDGSMIVGTGDAAVGTNSQNLNALGGKTLRLNRFTGKAWPTNKYATSKKPRRYVHTYGHRNVQGLAQRADGSLWSIEQGSDRDDEVNKLVNGGDYGWNPVPGYNESVPMTDQSLPGKQYRARWRSGYPTLATSGGTFVEGSKWGALGGALAVACLKASRVVFLTFDARGQLKKVRTPKQLRHYGRIRTVANASNGDLLLTTDNGNGRDSIVRVSAR